MASVSSPLAGDIAERLDAILTELKDLREDVEYPKVLRRVDESVTDLAIKAQETAASREFVGERLLAAQRSRTLARAMVKTLHDRINDRRDSYLKENSGRLIARGQAIDERRAEANLSLIELSVEQRKIEYRLSQVEAEVEWLYGCWQAWRDAEFALDRQIRLLQVRHALGEI